MDDKRLIVIGGGAAGFFGAISAAEHGFLGEIIILEKSAKVLTKVLVSGGGRCNVTHACFENQLLVQNYPRGNKELRGPFSAFNTTDTINWFEKRGVPLKTEKDGRMFPVTNNSQTIADCLLKEAKKHNIKIYLQHAVAHFLKNETFELVLTNQHIIRSDYLLAATGGHPKPEGYTWLTQPGHQLVSPVPSLFTFNIPDSPFKGLEGIAVEVAHIKIKNSTFHQTGPLLITHWGLSGPCILKLSAFAARWVHEQNYLFDLSISFLPHVDEEKLRALFLSYRSTSSQKKIMNSPFPELSNRLWQRLVSLSGIEEDEVWGQLKKEKINRLIKNLFSYEVSIKGKTTFKEEFVTAGGIPLTEITHQTMESKLIPNLYFAGEVLNVDGITGGFNFQHAWTSGWIAGKAIAEKSKPEKGPNH